MRSWKPHRPPIVASVLTLAAGIGIAWIDSRPTWDDAGVSAAAIFVAAGLGALFGLEFIYAAILVAAPILIVQLSGGSGVLIVVPLAVLGGMLGQFVRRGLGSGSPVEKPRA